MKKGIILILFLTVSLFSKSQINFTFKEKIKFDEEVRSVCIGDITNDRLDDVIVGTAYTWSNTTDEASIIVLKQDSLGNFSRFRDFKYPKIYPGLRSLSVADLNNDSIKDILISYGDNVGIFFLNANTDMINYSSFILRDVINTVPADMNNDGLIDIVVNRYYSEKNILYQSIYGGVDRYTYYAIETNYFAYALAGDFNGDNYEDVIFSQASGYPGNDTIFKVYEQDTVTHNLDKYTGVLYNRNYNNMINNFEIGDLNGDEKSDIIGISDYYNSVYIWYNQESKFSDPQIIPAFEYSSRVVISDLNCDLSNDIIGYDSNPFSIHENNHGLIGDYSTITIPGQYSSLSLNANSIAFGNLNTDHKPDIAFAFMDGIVLLENKSIPERFNKIDTIPQIDSIVNITRSTWFYSNRYSFIQNNYFYEITDSVATVTTVSSKKIISDSMYIRKGIICNENYIDTLRSDPKIFQTNIYRDSTYIYKTMVDSSEYNSTQNLHACNIVLFPNPVGDLINITTKNPATYIIINIYGETVKQGVLRGTTISVEELLPGSYFIQITDKAGELSIEKFIKLNE